jgi:hypothetical protein
MRNTLQLKAVCWLLVGMAVSCYASDEATGGILPSDALPGNLTWGQEVAGVRVALQIEDQSTDSLQSVQAKIYIKNSGSSNVTVTDFGAPLHGMVFFTKTGTGEINKVHFGKEVGDMDDIELAISIKIPPDTVYVFPVTLASEILSTVKGELFAGVNVGGPKGPNGIPWNLIYSNEMSVPQKLLSPKLP